MKREIRQTSLSLKRFDEPGHASSATGTRFPLCQGNLTVEQYTIQFRTLAAEHSWNNKTLATTFWQGLAECSKDKLSGREIPAILENVISLAIQIDTCFQERSQERQVFGFSSGSNLSTLLSFFQ